MVFFQLSLFICVLYCEIKGRPCDKDGVFLPPGSPPLPHSDPSPDVWDPFEDKTQFRKFCIKRSAGDIDELMDIWASSKAVDDLDS